MGYGRFWLHFDAENRNTESTNAPVAKSSPKDEPPLGTAITNSIMSGGITVEVSNTDGGLQRVVLPAVGQNDDNPIA